MAIKNKVSGSRCQVPGEKFPHRVLFSNLKPKTYNLEPKSYNLEPGTWNLHRGFTLIELLVVVAIITVVTGVVLTSNSKYGGSVLLQNLAYDIALSIRQAQVYGISVRGFGETNTFTSGYGMHFAISENDNTHYELFADKNGDGLFSDASENVDPSPYIIGRGYYIYKLCFPAGEEVAANSYDCISDPNKLTNQIDILFRRPEPDACISKGGDSAFNANGNCTGGQASTRVILASPRGDLLSVVVEATGQIAVQ
ncbi:MAG: prepilin-type N-terminal cleavage/methylation domain-containing protein [bacterium]|nr:prepilin-type N-terminal cleavage/methylation domain-containing protein [bacterium]